METKTCQFRTILDSATRSTSSRRFFTIYFRLGESPTLLPFKPLILTPPEKYLTIAFRWDLIGIFFVRVPDIISNMKNKKLPVGTRHRSSFIFSNGRPTMPEQKPWWHRAKKTRNVFLCSLHMTIKKRARRGSVLQATCGLTEPDKIPTQL